jgi:hypothetical protein
VVTKREPVKYCTLLHTVYFGWGVDRWKQRHICELAPHACAVMPWGGILGLAWDVAVMMPLQGSPQAWRSEA